MSDDAFESLYRTWYRTLVAKAFLVAGGRDVAEDAVQEAFIQCWRRMADPRGAPVKHWGGWLAVTAVREALHRRNTDVVFDPARHDSAAHALDLAVEVQLKEVYRRACAEMAGLRERPRRAMALRCIAGLNTAEVAQEMGITQSTVRVHLAEARRALEPLRVELRQMGIVTEGEGEHHG
ncbi:sigma-70 family RNA polymerase sigma factor [Streptomyces sp. S.PB5]|uniref:RNA polymerase sigma factor n=1 Tax=Streptomyces sp. S.PB5 TaxID=3020844 RepID=UPI0025B159E7|nr:sigma-70 family RNA polymerase sigma factor [Streptomyces sp. S.PB5]MDN3029743.1 sigma-70 family RNA polymerase sigma factor [Streptomyces sp. S.PB5]